MDNTVKSSCRNMVQDRQCRGTRHTCGPGLSQWSSLLSRLGKASTPRRVYFESARYLVGANAVVVFVDYRVSDHRGSKAGERRVDAANTRSAPATAPGS